MNLFTKLVLSILEYLFKSKFNMFDVIVMSILVLKVYPLVGLVPSIIIAAILAVLSGKIESTLFKGEK